MQMAMLRKRFKLKNNIAINFINLSKEEKGMVRRWRNNKDIRKWLFTGHIISAKEHSRFIEALEKGDKNTYWLVKNISGESLGVISLNRINFKNRNAYLGIYTNPEFRHPLAGRQLLALLKKIAFKIFKFHTLKLEVIADNKRAIGFYKKSGFIREGRLSEFVHKNGKWQDAIVMGIIRKGRN